VKREVRDQAGSIIQNAIRFDYPPRPSKRRKIAGADHQRDDGQLDEPDTVVEEPVTGPVLTGLMPPGGLHNTPRHAHPSKSLPAAYPPLTTGATAAQYLIDFKSVHTSGPTVDSRQYRQGCQWLTDALKRKIAHAVLMDEDFYGVESIQPCEGCVKRNEPCRIYHPDLQQYP
jgi:hypothetical protein